MSTANERGAQVVKMYKRLQTDRQRLNKTYINSYAYTNPIRGAAFATSTTDGYSNATSAATTKALLYDGTATEAVRLLASSILSSLTPPSLKWFGLALSGADVDDYDDLPSDAQEWLEDASEKLHQLIHASNYDGIALEFFEDIVIAGQAGLYVELNRYGKLQFEPWPLYSMFGTDTFRTGRIDSVYRFLQLTAAQAVDRFGINSVRSEIKDLYNTDPYSVKTFEFVHCIRPRLNAAGNQTQGKLKRTMPFESLYVDFKSNDLVMESGYEELPVIVPRWKRIPDTDSAFGPIYDALPDIKMLNRVTEMMIQSAEISIGGVYKVRDDGVVNPSTIVIKAGLMIPVSDMNNLQAITPAADVKLAVNEIVRLQAQVRRVMLADQLGPAEKQNMTATEIQTRTQIIRQVLGPIFSRLQSEFLEPLVTRCFGLCYRSNQLGTPPESLQNKIFDIVYRTPLARDQRRADLDAMTALEQNLGAALQAGISDAFDLYDFDAATRKRANLLGVDVSLIRDEATVRKLRKDRAEAAAAQAQQEQLAQQPPETPEFQ